MSSTRKTLAPKLLKSHGGSSRPFFQERQWMLPPCRAQYSQATRANEMGIPLCGAIRVAEEGRSKRKLPPPEGHSAVLQLFLCDITMSLSSEDCTFCIVPSTFCFKSLRMNFICLCAPIVASDVSVVRIVASFNGEETAPIERINAERLGIGNFENNLYYEDTSLLPLCFQWTLPKKWSEASISRAPVKLMILRQDQSSKLAETLTRRGLVGLALLDVRSALSKAPKFVKVQRRSKIAMPEVKLALSIGYVIHEAEVPSIAMTPRARFVQVKASTSSRALQVPVSAGASPEEAKEKDMQDEMMDPDFLMRSPIAGWGDEGGQELDAWEQLPLSPSERARLLLRTREGRGNGDTLRRYMLEEACMDENGDGAHR